MDDLEQEHWVHGVIRHRLALHSRRPHRGRGEQAGQREGGHTRLLQVRSRCILFRGDLRNERREQARIGHSAVGRSLAALVEERCMAVNKTVLFLSRPLQALALVLVVSLGAQGQKIHVNKYDPNADFSKFKTFAWAPPGAVARPLLVAITVGSIEDQLTQKGLKKVASNPDLILHVYGSIDQDSTFYSNDPL